MNDELRVKNNELGGKMNYRYRTDEEMKDSGIEWIGKIPKEWSIKPVKYLANKNQYYPIGDGDHGSIKPEMYQDEGVPYIRVQNLSWGNELNFEGMVYISEKVNNDNKKSILKPKDILIAKTGATIGKTAIIPEGILEANTTSSVGKVTVDHSKVDYKYVAYYFQSLPFLTQINMTAYQKSAQPGFNIDDLIDYKVSLPWEIRKQREISDFLDEKTAQFDSIISKKEALIEKLEEAKKSLISEVVTGKVKVVKTNDGYELVERKKEEMKECVGKIVKKIPSNWNEYKIKHACSIVRDGTHNPPQRVEVGYPLLSVRNVQGNKLLFLNDDSFISEYDFINLNKSFNITKGDLLLAIVGTSGKVAIVDSDREFFIQRSLAILRTKEKVCNNKMLFYIIMSNYFQKQLWSNVGFSAQPGIYLGSLLNFNLVLPELAEQECIVDMLETEVDRINSIINNINMQIKKIKEAKQSLISEAVTGKIEILD